MSFLNKVIQSIGVSHITVDDLNVYWSMVGPLAQLNSFGNFTDTFYVARDKAYIIGNIQDYIRSNLPHFMDI
jgi:hypothetical protein